MRGLRSTEPASDATAGRSGADMTPIRRSTADRCGTAAGRSPSWWRHGMTGASHCCSAAAVPSCSHRVRWSCESGSTCVNPARLRPTSHRSQRSASERSAMVQQTAAWREHHQASIRHYRDRLAVPSADLLASVRTSWSSRCFDLVRQPRAPERQPPLDPRPSPPEAGVG